MIRVMIFKGHCLAMKDIVRKSSYFCSRLSSAIRRLYLWACQKMEGCFL